MASIFHEGELAVQRQAGHERAAAQVGRYIGPRLRDDHADFLEGRPFVVVASQDAGGRVWASLIAGPVGFIRVLDSGRLLLNGRPAAGDPLAEALDAHDAAVGLISIEPDTRSRVRVNGRAHQSEDGILISVEEAFGNCPKYIQRRVPTAPLEGAGLSHRSGRRLDAGQAALIREADTFFIASVHPERGADASHRGGRPGFVEVDDEGGSLRFPDYAGNRMYQTLGNLTVDPRCGLLFLDWSTGTALQVSGRAAIRWDVTGCPTGTERVVELAVEAVREQPGAMPARWSLVEPWPRNP